MLRGNYQNPFVSKAMRERILNKNCYVRVPKILCECMKLGNSGKKKKFMVLSGLMNKEDFCL